MGLGVDVETGGIILDEEAFVIELQVLLPDLMEEIRASCHRPVL